MDSVWLSSEVVTNFDRVKLADRKRDYIPNWIEIICLHLLFPGNYRMLDKALSTQHEQ